MSGQPISPGMNNQIMTAARDKLAASRKKEEGFQRPPAGRTTTLLNRRQAGAAKGEEETDDSDSDDDDLYGTRRRRGGRGPRGQGDGAKGQRAIRKRRPGEQLQRANGQGQVRLRATS